jgi:adenylate kinase
MRNLSACDNRSMNVVLLGPPGSGKGTQAERLSDERKLRHISTGDLVRAHPDETERYARAGRLVPDDVMMRLLGGALDEGDGDVLLDGFPRSVEQAEALEDLLPLDAVVFLDVPDDVVLERLARRGREDDEPDVIRRRLDVYRDETAPLVSHYERRGLLRRVDGSRPPEEVYAQVRDALA